MLRKQFVLACCITLAIGLSSCSRQQSDWQKTRETNTPEAYEQFVKKYPSGEFTPQAQARLKELYDDRDWQKARDADTPEAYQAYLNQYPDGQSATEARNRLENFSMAQSPAGTPSAPGTAPQAAAGTSGRRRGLDRPRRPPPARTARRHRAAPRLLRLPRPRTRRLPSRPRSPRRILTMRHREGSHRRLCVTARRLPLGQRRGEQALGAFAEGISEFARGPQFQSRAEENCERHAVSAADCGFDRESCTQDLQGSQGQISALHHRARRTGLTSGAGSPASPSRLSLAEGGPV